MTGSFRGRLMTHPSVMGTSTNLQCLMNFVEANDVHGLERVLSCSRSQFTSERLHEERQGKTALHRAAELDHVDILKALVSAGGRLDFLFSRTL